jgi:hypothetical protein
MNRYENGKIYKLQFTDGHFYIGSTCVELSKRLYYHKCKINKTETDNHPMFQKWRIEGRNSVEIFLIEAFPCNTKNELEAKENEYILKHKDDPKCFNRKRAIADPDYNKKWEAAHPGRKQEYNNRPEVREAANERRRQRRADPEYRKKENAQRKINRQKKNIG